MKSLLAQRIRAARKALHPEVTQKEVAKHFELSPSAVNLWEAGKTEPGAYELLQMAKWFGVSTDWLLGLDDSKAPPARRGKPTVHVVPVLTADAIAKWRYDAVSEVIQTAVAYPEQTAAAMLVSSDALYSTCPSGSYAVISKAHPTDPGCIVLASISRAGEPVLRKLVREGRDDLLIADDTRYPTFRLADGARIIGRVTEITVRRMLI